MAARPPELVTKGLLCREFDRPAAEVQRALEREGFHPAAVAGNVKVYHPDVLCVLRRIFNTEEARQARDELVQLSSNDGREGSK